MGNLGIEVAVGSGSNGGETGHVLFRGGIHVVGGAVAVCDGVRGGGAGRGVRGGVEERWERDRGGGAGFRVEVDHVGVRAVFLATAAASC